MIQIPLLPHDISGWTALPWLGRRKGTILFVLTLLLVVAAFAAGWWYYGRFWPNWLGDQHDAISAVKDIVTLTILVAGSVFSYYRFFKGRTLSLRAELTVAVTVHETPEQDRLHAITLTAKNVGTASVWNPKATITARFHLPEGVEETHRLNNWLEEGGGEKTELSVMDAGETIQFFAHQRVPVAAWAVTYLASLHADQGDTWHVGQTVTNKASTGKDGSDTA